MIAHPSPNAASLALLLTDFGDGGVEHMVVNTANAISDSGVPVTLLVAARGTVPFLERLSCAVRVFELGAQGPSRARLADFLARERPRVLVSAKLRDDALAVDAREMARSDTRVYFRVGNPLVHRLRCRTRNPLRRWWALRRLRRLYGRADGYIAVSSGIALDLVDGLGLPRERVRVLPNPTITPDIEAASRQPPDHPWFTQGGAPPVILAVGGLRQQKNFQLLVRAFARVRKAVACRLVILGEGRQRERLLGLAAELGVRADVDLPGWTPNPYAFMRRAGVFVLSSSWEGSPNVLVEALSLGVPVVATDCISGPREILGNGRHGRLVPVSDVQAMADAVSLALSQPPPVEMIRAGAGPYRAESSAGAYMRALGLGPITA